MCPQVGIKDTGPLNHQDNIGTTQIDMRDHIGMRITDREPPENPGGGIEITLNRGPNHLKSLFGKIMGIEITINPVTNHIINVAIPGVMNRITKVFIIITIKTEGTQEYPYYQCQQYQQPGGQAQYDQYQYESRRSPIHTQNRYEAQRDFREEDQSRYFLDHQRSERTPPRHERMTNARSLNTRGDVEEDSRSKT